MNEFILKSVIAMNDRVQPCTCVYSATDLADSIRQGHSTLVSWSYQRSSYKLLMAQSTDIGPNIPIFECSIRLMPSFLLWTRSSHRSSGKHWLNIVKYDERILFYCIQRCVMIIFNKNCAES